MVNNFRRVENNLKAAAKRYKSIKYSIGLVILFLMMGVNAFSEDVSLNTLEKENSNQVMSKVEIKSTAAKLKERLEQLKKENQKGLSGEKLELIQLMEQGNQVVKSPWSTWQVGMNYFYVNSKDTYKGRGDKQENKIIERETKDPIKRYVKNSSLMNSSSSIYGTTELNYIDENPVDVTISVSIKPKSVNKEAPSFTAKAPGGSLPPFTLRTVLLPKVEPVVLNIPPVPNPPATDVGYQDIPKDKTGYDKYGSMGNNGIISQLNLTEGKYNLYMEGAGQSIKYAFSNVKTTDTGFENEADLTPSIKAEVSRNAFYGIGGRKEAIIDNSVEVNIIGNNTSGVALNSIYYLGNNGSAGNEESKLINRGTVNIYGNKIATVNIDNVSSPGNITFVNEGNIIGHNEKGKFASDTGDLEGADPGNHIFGAFSYGNEGIDTIENGEKGSVKFYAPESVAWAYTSSSSQQISRRAINNGEVKLYGRNSLGIATDNDASSEQMSFADIQLNKPIYILGNESVGASIRTQPQAEDTYDNDSNEYYKKYGKNFYGSKWNFQLGDNENKVQNSIGLNFDFDLRPLNLDDEVKINKWKIILDKNTENNVAMRVGQGNIVFDDKDNFSKIELNGKDGIAFLVDKSANTTSKLTYNNINSKSSIVLGNDNSGSILFAAINAGELKVNNKLTLNTKGEKLRGIYTRDNDSKVELVKGASIKHEGDGSIFGYSAGGEIKITNTALTLPTLTVGNIANQTSLLNTDSGINIKGKKAVGLYAAGGKIEAHDSILKVVDGSTLAYSTGAGSEVNLSHSYLDYSGDGYSLYADNSGKINVDNSIITLRGKAVGLKASSIGTDISTTGTKIVMMSNDAIPFDVHSLANVNVSGLDNSIGISNIDIIKGQEGSTVYDKFKKAYIDGIAELTFDNDLDKKDAIVEANETSTDVAKRSSYNFFRRYLVQKAKYKLDNKKITASLNSSELEKLNTSQVVGLELNSSGSATSVNDTQLLMTNGSVITANRTDSGNGAVGVFINYGKVNVDSTSKILVEKDSTANSEAVGVYSVNGSNVTNEGTIDVSGKDSIGILGMTYRTDASGNPIVNEFGVGAVGEGRANVLNKGKITLDGESAAGIFMKNNNADMTLLNTIAEGINDIGAEIVMSGNKSVGLSGERATLINRGTLDIKGKESIGIFGKKESRLVNEGSIKIADGESEDKPNIGIFAEDQKTEIGNAKDIIAGNNSYGIYGKTIVVEPTGKIKVGNKSVGIFSDGKYAVTTPSVMNLTLDAGSTLETGDDSVGIFSAGENQVILSKGDIKLGKDSYGIVLKGKGTALTAENPDVTLKENSTFIYSSDKTGKIENKTKLTSAGDKNYGIYSAGTVTNLADMNFGTGVGNVGMFAFDGGKIINGSTTVRPTITVSGTDKTNKNYGIGMAAGFVKEDGSVTTGTVVNYGNIKVEKDDGIAMYATGSGSLAENFGTIELNAKNAIGMYLDNYAVGINHTGAVIKTTPNSTKTGMTGIYLANNAVIKNYGTIEIENGYGIYKNKGKIEETELEAGTGNAIVKLSADKIEEKKQYPTGKVVAGIKIDAPGNGTAKIIRDGKVVEPVYINTLKAGPKVNEIQVGDTKLDLNLTHLKDILSMGGASEIGMYIDTSGINYTNPIKGLDKLTGLKKINLILGNEASRYTSAKNIKVGENILAPFNDAISSISGDPNIKFSINSGSLTWIATATQAEDDTFNNVYLAKLPYTVFAKERDTYNFMDGLEQRYGVETSGRERVLFDKLNSLGKGEQEHRIFVQAVDQMKGHQYVNTQQRIYQTGSILDKEFSYLRNEWQNVSKDSNKIKTFGTKGEYRTSTAGVYDYTNNAYGVAYVHENETLNLGKTSGWYTGIVENRIKFKDIGGSKEEQLQGKIGVFKSIPFDYDNSLNWTVSGELSLGYNKMNRRFWVVDDVFNAKSRYWNYGAAIKNEVSKDFRLSEDFSFKPYASAKVEYGRISKIREKSGEIRLEVKSNDYYSIKPEIGSELIFKHVANNKTFKATLGIAYENELGKIADGKNKARVLDTTADWFNIRGEKEDRHGNVKTDLKIGVDNSRVGLTANIGYDTKGRNVRGGVGLRVIF